MIIVLPRYGEYGASSRYRHYLLTDYLRKEGHSVRIFPFYIWKSNKFLMYPIYAFLRLLVLCIFHKRLFYVEGDFFPHMGIGISPRRYILDFDDPVWNWDKIFKSYSSRKWDRLVRGSEHLVSGSKETLNYWSKLQPKGLYAITTFPKNFYPCVDSIGSSKRSVLWIGSPSTSPHVDEIFRSEPELSSLFEWYLVGYSGTFSDTKEQIHTIEWSYDAELHYASKCNIAIAPLSSADSEAKFKCGFKIVQYCALGLKVVLNRSGVNKEWSWLNNAITVDADGKWSETLEKALAMPLDRSLIRTQFDQDLSGEIVFERIKNLIYKCAE